MRYKYASATGLARSLGPRKCAPLPLPETIGFSFVAAHSYGLGGRDRTCIVSLWSTPPGRVSDWR